MSQRRHSYSQHHRIQISSFQCRGERVEFDGFRRVFIGNWGTAGEGTCVPPSHLGLSHDQTTLRIDMSLSSADLLAVNTPERRTDECQRGTRGKNWDEG